MDDAPSAFYTRPDTLLAGFHADRPEPAVPELVHIGEQWAPRAFFVPRHAHSVWEWYVQESGQSAWDGPDGRTYSLAAGGFLAVPPGAAHTMHEKSAGRHHFFFAALDVDVLAQRLSLPPGAWANAVFYSPHGESLLAPFRQLVREVALSQPLRAAGVRAAVDALVIEGTRLLLGPSPETLVMLHPATVRARELMERAPDEKWTLSALAAAAGVSAGHLAEVWTRDMSQPPHQFLLALRVRRAGEMLRGTDLPVTDIALETGWSSSQHFAAAFKKATGRTARQWREDGP